MQSFSYKAKIFINIKNYPKRCSGRGERSLFSRAPRYWCILAASVTTVITIAVVVHHRGLYKQQVWREMWSFSMTRATFWIIFDVCLCLRLMGNRLRMFLLALDEDITVFLYCYYFFMKIHKSLEISSQLRGGAHMSQNPNVSGS